MGICRYFCFRIIDSDIMSVKIRIFILLFQHYAIINNFFSKEDPAVFFTWQERAKKSGANAPLFFIRIYMAG